MHHCPDYVHFTAAWFAFWVNCLIPVNCLISEYMKMSKIQVHLGRDDQIKGGDHPSRIQSQEREGQEAIPVRTEKQGARRKGLE